MTPQIPPDTRNTAPASTPSTTAPTRIGHEPRKTRAKPCAVGTTSTGGGGRRRCTARVTSTIPASTAIVIAHEPNQPTWSASSTPGKAGQPFRSG